MASFSFLIVCAFVQNVVITDAISKTSYEVLPFYKEAPSKTSVVESKIDAFRFLNQFGYNPCKNSAGAKSSSYDGPLCQSSIESMLADFQANFQLPVTGKLDAPTRKLMNTPRCSLHDSPASLTSNRKLWPQDRILTWKLNQDGLFVGSAKVRQYIQQAFNDWAKHTGLTFREVFGKKRTDFNLDFVHSDHADEFPFDGPKGTLGHAFYPWDGLKRGIIHFDATEKWTDTYDGEGVNLRLVAAHEIGHSLGLPHTFRAHALMNPFYQMIKPNHMLPIEDRKRIRFLYPIKKIFTIAITTPRTIITKWTTTTKPTRTTRRAEITKSKITTKPTTIIKRRTTTTQPATTTRRPTTTKSKITMKSVTTTKRTTTTSRPIPVKFNTKTKPKTTTKLMTTVKPTTNTKRMTTAKPKTTTKQTTTTNRPVTRKSIISKKSITITKLTTTVKPTTNAKRTTTTKPKITRKQTTTTNRPATTKFNTTTKPKTATKLITAGKPMPTIKQTTTTSRSVTTTKPKTSIKLTTTIKPTITTKRMTTTKLMITTKPATTTSRPATTKPTTIKNRKQLQK